jgi:hypothetical protein
MDAKSWSSDATLRLQSLQPQFRWQVTAGFLSVIFILGLASFSEHGVQSVYYGTLSAAGAVALIVQYRRECALVRDRLIEVGTVTDWGRPTNGKLSAFRFRLCLPHHLPHRRRGSRCALLTPGL